MMKYSFYGFIAGQIIFVFLIEALFFFSYVRASLSQHIILGSATFIVTALSYFVSKKMIETDPHYFIQTVIGSTSVKLLIYIGLIAALLYFYSGPAISYIFFFFICYLLVTTTEIISLVRSLRKQQNKAG